MLIRISDRGKGQRRRVRGAQGGEDEGCIYIENGERERRQQAGGDRQGLSLTLSSTGPCVALPCVPRVGWGYL